MKYQLIDMENEHVIAKGNCERIGIEGGLISYKTDSDVSGKEDCYFPSHTEAFAKVIEVLTSGDGKVIDSVAEISAVGHRVLHGSEVYKQSTLITDKVIDDIESFSDLGPLHNPPQAATMRACRKVLGPDVPMVAVFDTSFHQTMPEKAYMYAVPHEYYEKYHIRKYGFHGTSHHYVTLATAKFLNQKVEDTTIITCHLGNGCSMAAVKNGKVIDTTMGLTPLEGLMMGTRCGDLDPAAVIRLVDLGHTTAEVDKILNKQSGLYGVGDINSGDMRDMLAAAEKGSERAELALKMFARRIVKYIGAYYVLLDGPQAISFTGGVGEFSVPMRKRIMDQLGSLGLKLDDGRNAECFGKAGVISTDDSSWKAIVMPTDEELMIARSVVDTLHLK